MTTALGIITSAMRIGGILTKNESPSADEAVDGLERLNDLIASLSNDTLIIYARTLENFPLSGGIADYTIGPGATFNTVRPIRIVSAYIRSGGIDYNLELVSDERYATIVFKNNLGSPPQFLNYTNAYPSATIRLHATPASSDVLYLLTEKPLTSLSLNDVVSLPPGYERMLKYNLAVDMGPEYGQPISAEVFEIAKESKGLIKSSIMAAKKMQWNSGLCASGNVYNGWQS